MNKDQLLETTGVNLNLSPEQSESIYNALISSIKEYALDLDTIAIPGFGSFISAKHDEVIVEDLNGNNTLLPPCIDLSFIPSVVLRKKMIG